MTETNRINKYLASNNICSRREADKLIMEEKVKINGRIAKLGDQVVLGDNVEVARDGLSEKKLMYLACYKPRGVVTHSPQEGERQASDVMPQVKNLFPLGRLDKDSEGLILWTNDGRITDRLLNPKYCHEKEYKVTVDRILDSKFLHNLRRGVRLDDGYVTRACKAVKLDQTSFSVIITEGKKRQIRKMCGVLGYGVKRLERKRIMNIDLGNLKPGQCRNIKGKEWGEFSVSLGIER